MASLERFHEMTEDYSELADFALVYTAEAHPIDGYFLKDNLQIPKHKTLEERYKAAQLMLDQQPQSCPVLVDRLSDEANKAYAASPGRLYIVLEGIVVYKGGQGPLGYKINEVEAWLEAFREHKQLMTISTVQNVEARHDLPNPA
ncbi:thyroxine 5-deiodinase-like isoform X1 [Penaeus vannamei]|uniref:thyroxine 5-deiodinase-like isoform X1 n=1 Tax=Penaeus vannamei TaxID=6689 RepID=UPI00387FA57A